MKSANNRTNQYWLLSILPRLVLLGASVSGWFVAHWLGLIGGFIVGCLLAFLTWATLYYFLTKARITKQSLEISKLSDEQLKEIAVDPTSTNLGFAMAELERREITNIRPSLESLFELITSSNPNTRGLGLGHLITMYPEACQKIAIEGTSSTDAPEVWQQRITAFKAAH